MQNQSPTNLPLHHTPLHSSNESSSPISGSPSSSPSGKFVSRREIAEKPQSPQLDHHRSHDSYFVHVWKQLSSKTLSQSEIYPLLAKNRVLRSLLKPEEEQLRQKSISCNTLFCLPNCKSLTSSADPRQFLAISTEFLRAHILTFNGNEFSSLGGNVKGHLNIKSKNLELADGTRVPVLKVGKIDLSRVVRKQKGKLLLLITSMPLVEGIDGKGKGDITEKLTLKNFLKRYPSHKEKLEEAKRVLKHEFCEHKAKDYHRKLVFDFVGQFQDLFLKQNYWLSASPPDALALAESLRKAALKSVYPLILKDEQSEIEELVQHNTEFHNFIEPSHLEMAQPDPSLLESAIEELRLIQKVVSPRKKLECLLNCCQMIKFILTGTGESTGADDFLPHFILVVLRAKIPTICFEVQFIQRYVFPDELAGEVLYYYTQLVSCIYFIEQLSVNHLKIDPIEYERQIKDKIEEQWHVL